MRTRRVPWSTKPDRSLLAKRLEGCGDVTREIPKAQFILVYCLFLLAFCQSVKGGTIADLLGGMARECNQAIVRGECYELGPPVSTLNLLNLAGYCRFGLGCTSAISS